MEWDFLVRKSNPRQGIFGLINAGNRRAKHRRQRDVLLLVVQHLQNRQHFLHFDGFEESRAVLRAHRDTEPRKCLRKLAGPESRCAQKNGDVVWFYGPEAIFFGKIDLFELAIGRDQQIANEVRHMAGLHLRHLQFIFLIIVAGGLLGLIRGLRQLVLVQQVQFDGCSREALGHFRVLHDRGKLVPGGVLDLSGLTGHQPAENTIDRLQQRPACAEVLAQLNRHAAGSTAIPLAAPEEQVRLGETESIDALLHIADAEQIPRHALIAPTFPTCESQNLLLHRVDVLVFIDQHVLIALMQTPGQVARLPGLARTARCAKQVQRCVFKVREVQRVLTSLRLIIAIFELPHEVQKHGRVRKRPPNIIDQPPFL